MAQMYRVFHVDLHHHGRLLTLGLATEEAFLPLDSQIYVSQVKARELIKPYKDGRSVAGKRYSEATTQSKPICRTAMENISRHHIRYAQ
jgi:hypothetical protein